MQMGQVFVLLARQASHKMPTIAQSATPHNQSLLQELRVLAGASVVETCVHRVHRHVRRVRLVPRMIVSHVQLALLRSMEVV